MIDAHNHLLDFRFKQKPNELIAHMADAGISACVINSTCASEWDALSQLSRQFPLQIIPCFGIHPWKADTYDDPQLALLRHLLISYPQAAIGECGLDLWVHNPSIEQQIPVFMKQIELSNELNRTLSIHCLKAWKPLLDVLKSNPPQHPFLMHSYSGSIETAQQLLTLGAYFSFSGYFLHARKSKILEVFKQLPLERLLIETDAPDMMLPQELLPDHSETINYPHYLPIILNEFAQHLGLCPMDLERITIDNTKKCFQLNA
jgi:TatD DNase family protein